MLSCGFISNFVGVHESHMTGGDGTHDCFNYGTESIDDDKNLLFCRLYGAGLFEKALKNLC